MTFGIRDSCPDAFGRAGELGRSNSERKTQSSQMRQNDAPRRIRWKQSIATDGWSKLATGSRYSVKSDPQNSRLANFTDE